ncbi:hypothetical protein AQF52_6601 [Streptomyces venezuelae]|uniref:hypothetical protein n=1 Tax=Streptomyces gardneri TaxID=66892 RepID=UPI0006BC52AE|nr:hypothetical protein [Streptomyces gardneri]ALO12194.1 hypothetical protein AQF52_6601 [Streptomyces venezuelae]QPK49015.1 hypothetical protein H4W23_33155 [Streptomyces gardneri]WRK40505.1 hypothetical protein U0M97_33310 [Streptomyces venezuelae]CUM37225.1 hypothetical protein BN2537_3415 [Streptomyces venezuelae]
MRTDDDVRDLPLFILKRIKTSRDWDRFLIAQAQRYLVRALPEAKARTAYGDLTQVAASLNGGNETVTPMDAFARMEPLLETFADIEDLCPPPRRIPIGIRWPNATRDLDVVEGPVPDPWLIMGPLPDPWLPFPDVTPVRALPVLEALGSLAEAFTDRQAAKKFGEVLARAQSDIT